ncbi:GNAT family N-acetyltransferase [uncultured Bacteroides sp.]|uniref:GNAT family N-acetyltransferase n=1 Tax=uncultured Bacteroides sp. TaxID=162156 RepID=UPI002AABBA8B|nr:GNAT family N-acetyltransferase [uncultured Bacteroides sp.]
MLLKLITYYHANDIPDLPGTNIFYSKEIFHVYEATPGYTPILIVAYDGIIPIAKILTVVRKCIRFVPPSLINQYEIYGTGEFFDEKIDAEEVFGYMLEYITSIGAQESFLIEFRNLENSLFGYKAFRENEYFPVNWLRVRNSFHNTSDLLNKVSVSRRRQIKKGYANGAQVSVVDKLEDIRSFSQMLKTNYSYNIRKHFPCLEFFEYLDEKAIHSKIIKVFIVKYKENIIGGSVIIFSGKNAYLLFSGGIRKTHKKLYPGVLAIWEALKFAQNEGYEHLEYMDVGLPFRKHGFRDFVLRFGGKQQSSRRWFHLKWSFLNNFLIRIYT